MSIPNFNHTIWTPYEERVVDNDKFDGYTIDTVYACDTEMYETGIKYKDSQWIIVEEYRTKKEAQKGQDKWLKRIEKYKPKEIYSIQTGKIEEFHYTNFIYKLGQNTTEAEYKRRADVVLKWWGIWGLTEFKLGYKNRGKQCK